MSCDILTTQSYRTHTLCCCIIMYKSSRTMPCSREQSDEHAEVGREWGGGDNAKTMAEAKKKQRDIDSHNKWREQRLNKYDAHKRRTNGSNEWIGHFSSPSPLLPVSIVSACGVSCTTMCKIYTVCCAWKHHPMDDRQPSQIMYCYYYFVVVACFTACRILLLVCVCVFECGILLALLLLIFFYSRFFIVRNTF